MRQGIQRRVEHLEESSGHLYSADKPRENFRVVIRGMGWTPVPGCKESWSIGPLDWEKSTCRRTLHSDGTLVELATIYGNHFDLTEDDLDRWIATQPLERE